MKKTFLFCIGLTLLLGACNTVQGAGEDIQGAGQGIAHTASKVKEKITDK